MSQCAAAILHTRERRYLGRRPFLRPQIRLDQGQRKETNPT
jgi:hypothetical protein